jgi:phytoene desaturase
LRLFYKLKALTKHFDHVGQYFNDPRLKIAFTFQNVYMGLNPFDAPAIYSLLQYTELTDGVWYPIGGMYQVIVALTGIAQKWGVRFLCNAAVQMIDVKGQEVTGVTLANGEKLRADIVVANADLPYVYRHLLPDDGTARRLERKKYGCSALVFHWGVDKQYLQLNPHNLFLAGDYRKSFDPIFKDLPLPDELNFYVHAPVRVDPTLAPAGQDTIMVAIPIRHINDTVPQDWDEMRRSTRQAVLQRFRDIGMTDLEDHIKFEVIYDPRDWQSRYNLVKGSTHGLNHDILQMGYLRPRNRHARYRNLYFVGASTHPGTGLPTVLVSARHTANRILEDAGATQPVVSGKLSSITSNS